MVDFRVVSVLLPHLLIVLLFFLSIVIVQCFQVFPSVVLFHHFISLELIMSLFVVVLQIFSGLDAGENKLNPPPLNPPSRQLVQCNSHECNSILSCCIHLNTKLTLLTTFSILYCLIRLHSFSVSLGEQKQLVKMSNVLEVSNLSQ